MTLRAGDRWLGFGGCAVLASALVACAPSARCPPQKECPVCPPAASAAAAPVATPSSLPIDLPRAAELAELQAILAISIAANGDVFVGGNRVASTDEVRDAARAHSAKDPAARAMIQADRSARHGAVIGVIDALKQGGVTRVAFGVAASEPVVAPAP